ncbi:MAG: hypothetical protein HYY16_04995 [Planctomycetes bacterium]|nr:hypothetical protein [Planctomycetota bacterium]
MAIALSVTSIILASGCSQPTPSAVATETPALLYESAGRHSLEWAVPADAPPHKVLDWGEDVSTLRLTRSGSVLAATHTGLLAEFDGKGALIWLRRFALDPDEWVSCAEPLPNRNVVVVKSNGGARSSVIVEIDRTGKTVRRIRLPRVWGAIGSVRFVNEDVLLASFWERGLVLEIDWNGLERFRLPIPPGARPYDALRLPDGHYRIALNILESPLHVKGDPNVVVQEVTGDGKVLWDALADNLVSLQALPDGNTLCGAC